MITGIQVGIKVKEFTNVTNAKYIVVQETGSSSFNTLNEVVVNGKTLMEC